MIIKRLYDFIRKRERKFFVRGLKLTLCYARILQPSH